MIEPMRVSAEEARKRITSGGTLLVCAYEEEEKFRNMHLLGAISLQDLKRRLPSLAKGQEMIFY